VRGVFRQGGGEERGRAAGGGGAGHFFRWFLVKKEAEWWEWVEGTTFLGFGGGGAVGREVEAAEASRDSDLRWEL
jgi:hypothetical protein